MAPGSLGKTHSVKYLPVYSVFRILSILYRTHHSHRATLPLWNHETWSAEKHWTSRRTSTAGNHRAIGFFWAPGAII